MILHRIDYNGGDIWVNKEAKIQLGDWVFELQPKDNIGDVHFINGEYVIANDIQHKIVAQSTNLSLPNIPYVEIEEDIRQLAMEACKNEFSQALAADYWEQGYKAASANGKYTEEDLIAFGKKCFYKGFNKSETDDANCFTAWIEESFNLIQSLKPKVVSIEVEMEQYDFDEEWSEIGGVFETYKERPKVVNGEVKVLRIVKRGSVVNS